VGWMNPLLEKIHFFRLAESLVASLRPQLLHSQGVSIGMRRFDR